MLVICHLWHHGSNETMCVNCDTYTFKKCIIACQYSIASNFAYNTMNSHMVQFCLYENVAYHNVSNVTKSKNDTTELTIE